MKGKKKDRFIVGAEVFLLCMIVGVFKIHAASSNPPSNEVNYNKNNQATVQNAVNDLYKKSIYGNAQANEIRSGKTALVGGKQVVGTYTCPSLETQTQGDATPEDIENGKIAWVNGKKIVGERTSLTEQLKLGDYISYTSNKDLDTPTYNRLTLWRVIRKNEDGTVELVSHTVASVVGTYCSNAYSKDSAVYTYKNYIGLLNKEARKYETEGITVGSRAMGYGGKVVEYIDKLKWDRNYNGDIIYYSVPDEGFRNDIELVESALGTLKATKTSIAGSGTSYHLASRSSDAQGFGTYGRIVDKEGNIGQDELYKSDYGECIITRPIVVLKSALTITGGNGTEKSPYTLGI